MTDPPPDDLLAWLREQVDEDERHLGHSAYECDDPHQHVGGLRWAGEVEAKRLRLDYLAGLEHDIGSEDFVTFDSCRILAKPGELGDLEVGYCSCGLDAMRNRLFKIEAMPYAARPGLPEQLRP